MTPRDPIFILGILQRSGTNWLRDLLLCHPTCYAAKIPEDFILPNSHLLLRFGESLYGSWPEKWRADRRVGARGRLHRLLGNALLEFIDDPSAGGDAASPPLRARRLVTKTPSVVNLANCFDFFPEAQLVILVRDGRAVVESLVRGFTWDYETAIRRWDSAAREILGFLAEGAPPERTILVRYEDLYTATESELQRVLGFLRLDPAAYDFEQAAALEVRGSSVFGRAEGNGRMRRVARTAEFSPLDRAANWSEWRHERFNRLAGERLEALGYRKVEPGRRPALWPVRHLIQDVAWSLPRRLLDVGFLLDRALRRSDPDFKDARHVYYLRKRHAKAAPAAKAPPETNPTRDPQPATTTTPG